VAADEDGLPQDWLEQDATGSYYDAIAEIGKRVHAGEPVPQCCQGGDRRPHRAGRALGLAAELLAAAHRLGRVGCPCKAAGSP
jgi:hypothetical protein